MTVRRGLGRGLGALLPPAPTADREELAAAGAPLAAAPPVGALISDAVEVPLPSGSQPPADVDAGASLEGIDDREASRQLGGAELHTVEDLGEESADRPQQGAAYFTELSIDSVRANPRQPREVFDDEALQELADSLALVGVLQPVVVRPAEGGTFELIMGERRWRAAQRAGLQQIPAIVRPTSDAALLRDALLENLHRADLNALEEAAAYQQLLDDFGVTQEELAARIGRSRPHISNTIRLLRLSPAVQRRVAAGVLSAGHARALLSVADAEAQDRLASRVVAEGLSVRALEELVAAPAGETSTSLRGRASAVRLPELAEIADRLSERFETRCSVDLGKRKGKITIEFATLEDLHRILRTVEQSSDRGQL